MNISDIDTRDFKDIPRDEVRAQINHILLFLAGSFKDQLEPEEIRKLHSLAKDIS